MSSFIEKYLENFEPFIDLDEGKGKIGRGEPWDAEQLALSKFEGYPKVEYYGKIPLNRECKHGRPMYQLKMTINNISAQHMNELIDMGWRREGTNFYTTVMDCCHTYALRLDVHSFKPSKTHRKILKNMADFLRHGDNDASSNDEEKVMKVAGRKNQPNTATMLELFEKVFENCDAHQLEIRHIRADSAEFRETFEESFQLFKTYQEYIFKKSPTREEFENIFVSTPLKNLENEGTFHTQYLLDGKIIGVEMFDVLPNYLLGQTQYYDPELLKLNIGTFMILSQISLTEKLSKTLGRQLHISTGLYNHCFKKHHYKLQFASEILSIHSRSWLPLTKPLLKMLENEELITSSTDSSLMRSLDIFSVPCLYKGKIFKHETLQEILPEEDRKRFNERLDEFISEMGCFAKKSVFVF